MSYQIEEVDAVEDKASLSFVIRDVTSDLLFVLFRFKAFPWHEKVQREVSVT